MKLVLLVGISLSGKSTWIKEHQHKWKKTVVVNFDAIREELTGNISDHSMEASVVRIGYQTIKNNLKNGKNVILDATNLYPKHRLLLYFYLIKRFVFFKGLAIIFPANLELSKNRMKKCIDNNINRSVVPDKVLERQFMWYNKYNHRLKPIWLLGDGFKVIDEYQE
jgi:predicted kinase